MFSDRKVLLRTQALLVFGRLNARMHNLALACRNAATKRFVTATSLPGNTPRLRFESMSTSTAPLLRRIIASAKAESSEGATSTRPVSAESSSRSQDSEDAEAQSSAEDSAKGSTELLSTLSLFLVAVLWGTNPVCLRYTYLLKQPPSPAALAAIQAAGAAVLLSTVNAVSHSFSNERPSSAQSEESQAHSSTDNGQAHALRIDDPISAGAEVGAWTFAANAATISAFQHTPASRGAFLLRLTAVFTPAISKLSGQSVSLREWAACSVALLGGVLISLDSFLNSDAASGDLALGIGDTVMVLSALLWSIQTVRLGRHAQHFEPLTLAQNQTITLALLSGLWLLASFLLAESPEQTPVGSLLTGSAGLLTWAAVLWPAIGPWGIGTALQVRAQGTVTASRTQIILATDPVWATLLAGLLGGAEQSLGTLGWLGATCVILASAVSKH